MIIKVNKSSVCMRLTTRVRRRCSSLYSWLHWSIQCSCAMSVLFAFSQTRSTTSFKVNFICCYFNYHKLVKRRENFTFLQDKLLWFIFSVAEPKWFFLLNLSLYFVWAMISKYNSSGVLHAPTLPRSTRVWTPSSYHDLFSSLYGWCSWAFWAIMTYNKAAAVVTDTTPTGRFISCDKSKNGTERSPLLWVEVIARNIIG